MCCRIGTFGHVHPQAGVRGCTRFVLYTQCQCLQIFSLSRVTYVQAAAQSEVSNADSVNSFTPMYVS
jgi:hypothetical protein